MRRVGRVRAEILGNAVVVHVWLIPLVPALVPQRLLVHPQEVLVGRKKVVVVVTLGRVRHVVGNEVVEAAQGTRETVLGSLGRELC